MAAVIAELLRVVGLRVALVEQLEVFGNPNRGALGHRDLELRETFEDTPPEEKGQRPGAPPDDLGDVDAHRTG
jgi:hypothetical protein